MNENHSDQFTFNTTNRTDLVRTIIHRKCILRVDTVRKAWQSVHTHYKQNALHSFCPSNLVFCRSQSQSLFWHHLLTQRLRWCWKVKKLTGLMCFIGEQLHQHSYFRNVCFHLSIVEFIAAYKGISFLKNVIFKSSVFIYLFIHLFAAVFN